jgi:hypothetical protein
MKGEIQPDVFAEYHEKDVRDIKSREEILQQTQCTFVVRTRR